MNKIFIKYVSSGLIVTATMFVTSCMNNAHTNKNTPAGDVVNMTRYGSLTDAGKTCWPLAARAYSNVNNSGMFIHTVVDKVEVIDGKIGCIVHYNWSYNGKESKNPLQDVSDLSENNIAIGFINGYQSIAYAKPDDTVAKIIKEAHPVSYPKISANGKYTALVDQDPSNKLFVAELNSTSYHIIPIKFNDQDLSIDDGIANEVSNDGSVVVSHSAVAKLIDNAYGVHKYQFPKLVQRVKDSDIKFDQALCQISGGVSNCNPIKFERGDGPIPFRDLHISSNNQIFGIGATKSYGFSIYSINYAAPYDVTQLPGLDGEIYENGFGGQSGIDTVFDNNMILFLIIFGYDDNVPNVKQFLYVPATSTTPTKIIDVAQLITNMKLPGIHGEDFLLDKISKNGKNFSLFNMKVYADAMSDKGFVPQSADVLSVTVQYKNKAIWDFQK